VQVVERAQWSRRFSDAIREAPDAYGGGKIYLEQLGTHYARQFGLTVAGLQPSIVFGWGRQRGASAFAGELAETVQRMAPGDRIEVRSAGERDLAGLVTRVAERALEETLGVWPRFTPLEVGLRAHIEVARRRGGQGLDDPGRSEP
jgi:nucleoside-diphosphate-sugar epimerase